MAATKTGDSTLDDILEEYEYDKTNWQPIRDEAATDMRFVSGDPWDEADKELRGEDRPTVAPEEMSQYRNQVVNALMSNPRGAKFSPAGNGAYEEGAQFYQNKWREVEYRSHAAQQYVIAADNALQRSYGFLRVQTKYASPRSANQDIWLDAFADPDMVLPDTDAKQLDGSDFKRGVIHEWLSQTEFKRLYKHAKIKNISDFSSEKKSWIQGTKILRAEVWRIETRPRKLVLLQAPPVQSTNSMMPPARPKPMQAFEDEVVGLMRKYPGLAFARHLRDVDFPFVKQYFTNGLEILDEKDFVGEHIPIAPCYGKVIYVPKAGDSERVILSMTRFGRAPWKSYCYACSQQLEVLGMVPKSPLMAIEGQFADREDDVEEVSYSPKAFLYYKAKTTATGDALLPPPFPIDYPVGQHLQALEMVKEGFRRAIQAAMGSNFLPTDAQRINGKSGEALKKIDDVATQGTYHFVYAYDSMIRRAAVIGENIIDKIFDYEGETPVRTADQKSEIISINSPTDAKSIRTAGDYGVTVSTGPSSDSEREAAQDFTDQLTAKIGDLANIVGPKVASAVLAISIRMRSAQLGPMADQLADLIEPAEFKKGKDGQKPDPQLLAAQAQIQQLTETLKKAAFELESKQVEAQGKVELEQMRLAGDQDTKLKLADKQADLALALQVLKNAATIAAAHISSKKPTAGEHAEEEAQALDHEAEQAGLDRLHDLNLSVLEHQQAREAAEHAADLARRQTSHEALLAPPPAAGAGGASAAV